MVHVLIQLQVEEFERFWSGFTTRGLPLRQQHGSQGASVFRVHDDPNRVILLFQWSSEEAVKAFFEDPQVQESQRRGGMLGSPTITILDKAGDIEA